MSRTQKRPDFIRNWRELEAPAAPPNSPEDFGFASEFAPAAGIAHLRVAQLRIPPGARAYPPLAARDLEIFVFVLEGRPDLWIDGQLYRLAQGDGVWLIPRTGAAHSLINNTGRDARVFVMSQALPRGMKVVHPRDPAANENLKKMGMHWDDAPKRKLGLNGGKPGDESGRKRGKPAFVTHWRDILDKKAGRYPDSDEDQGIDARFGLKARFSRIGIHVEVLKPGRRTSWPHAERDEDEFVYVVSGAVDAWNDGTITPLSEGDFIGWRSGTGITHAILNNSDADSILLVGGEASRMRNQFWYPFHPRRNNEVGALYWADHPVPKLGPHDGMPDALRARVPKSARKSAIKANERARLLGKLKKRK
jgi:uncharacterized cupin superfamily protein